MCVCDISTKVRKHKASVRTEEIVSAAWVAITRIRRKSIQRLAWLTGDSTSTAWKICCDGCVDLSV